MTGGFHPIHTCDCRLQDSITSKNCTKFQYPASRSAPQSLRSLAMSGTYMHPIAPLRLPEHCIRHPRSTSGKRSAASEEDMSPKSSLSPSPADAPTTPLVGVKRNGRPTSLFQDILAKYSAKKMGQCTETGVRDQQ